MDATIIATAGFAVHVSSHCCSSPRKKNSSDNATTQRMPTNVPSAWRRLYGCSRTSTKPSAQYVPTTNGKENTKYFKPFNHSVRVGKNRYSGAAPDLNCRIAIAPVRISITCPRIESDTLGIGERYTASKNFPAINAVMIARNPRSVTAEAGNKMYQKDTPATTGSNSPAFANVAVPVPTESTIQGSIDAHTITPACTIRGRRESSARNPANAGNR